MTEVIEDKLCTDCVHKDICGLRIRISTICAFLTGHADGVELHHWYLSFANICKHYETLTSIMSKGVRTETK